MIRKTLARCVVAVFSIFLCGTDAVASTTGRYGSNNPRTTVVETSGGRRLVISTDQSGTVITEERSGREVSRYVSDRHEAKIEEYTRNGGKLVQPKK